MNLDERNEGSRGYRSFRTGLDLGMGVLYVAIGCLILYIKHFGAMELPTTFAYILGSLMLLYGVFRIYRGFVGMKEGKRR